MFKFARALRHKRAQGLVIAAVALAALVSANTALAQVSQRACDKRNNNTYQKLLECVRVDQVREHQAALQAIADANGGNRAAGSRGYNASVDYVVDTLEAAGWNVELDEFDVHAFTPPSTLQQLTPVNAAPTTTGALRGIRPVGAVTCGPGHAGRHQPGARRVRPRAAARLRTSPAYSAAEQHRADPARHLHLRHQGENAAGCRGRRP